MNRHIRDACIIGVRNNPYKIGYIVNADRMSISIYSDLGHPNRQLFLYEEDENTLHSWLEKEGRHNVLICTDIGKVPLDLLLELRKSFSQEVKQF